MEQLWTPWRYRYVTQAVKATGCVFCEKAAASPSSDRENLILRRGTHSFTILNLFPYTTGHSMVVPYAHVSALTGLDGETLAEMMQSARDAVEALGSVYRPDGFNLGMNLGRIAGAGIADHVHLHVLPRWAGDTNFMTVVGETRLQPEDLTTTYDKLAAFFER